MRYQEIVEVIKSKDRDFDKNDPQTFFDRDSVNPRMTRTDDGEFAVFSDDSGYSLYLMVGDTPAAYLSVHGVRYVPGGQQVDQIVVVKALRGRGLAGRLYRHAILTMGLTLVSDRYHQTKADLLWASLAKDPAIDMQCVDTTSGELHDVWLVGGKLKSDVKIYGDAHILLVAKAKN